MRQKNKMIQIISYLSNSFGGEQKLSPPNPQLYEHTKPITFEILMNLGIAFFHIY